MQPKHRDLKMFKTIKNTIITFLFLLLVINPANAIKIGLIEGENNITIAVSERGTLLDGNTRKKLADLEPMEKYVIKKHFNTIAIKLPDKKFYNTKTNNLIFSTNKNAFIFSKGKWYRGSMLAQVRGNGITVINDVSLEYYLLGVVPSEMPSKWNQEALKAQAIAARSYAIANLGKRGSKGYDLKDTPEDQAYGGASAETKETNMAVKSTLGEVLVYNNKVIPAYYHASAGGHTRNASAVWSRDLPYLASVPSFDDGIAKKGHGVGLSQYGANNMSKYGYNAYQILNYFYKNVSLGNVHTSF